MSPSLRESTSNAAVHTAHQPWCTYPDHDPDVTGCYGPVLPLGSGLSAWLTVGPDGPRLVVDGPGVDVVLDPARFLPALRALVEVFDVPGGRR